MSQDDVSYYGYMTGDGFATRLVIGDDGYPTNEYIQDDGNGRTRLLRPCAAAGGLYKGAPPTFPIKARGLHLLSPATTAY